MPPEKVSNTFKYNKHNIRVSKGNRTGHYLSPGGEDLGLNKVKFNRSPFEYYFTEVIPPTRAKQPSMATIPLCFEFFQCRVDVLQS